MAGGVHGPGQTAPSFVDKGVGISTRFANMFGANGGQAVGGNARTYMGTTYAEKPAFKQMLTDPAAYSKAAATFKEQRVAKHRDRLMEELTKPQPDLRVIKSTINKLSKIAGGHPFRFAHTLPDAGPQRAAAATQWSRLRQGIANVSPSLSKAHQAKLARLDKAAANVESTIAKANTLDGKKQNFSGATLGEIHDPTKQIAYSSDGMGGAMLIRPAQNAPLEAVLKCDDLEAMQNSADIANMLHYVGTHADVGLPFDFPMHKIIDATQADKTKLQTMLTGYKQGFEQQAAAIPLPHDVNNVAYNKASQRVDAVKVRMDNLNNCGKVLKQEALTGVTPSSRTTAEKITMMNDPQFAQDMGMMTLLAPMFALRDHIALDGGGYVSMTNFIYDPATKRLGVIDLAAKEHGMANAPKLGTNPGPYCAGPLKDMVNELRTVAKTATPDNVAAKFQAMTTMTMGAARAFLTPGVTGMGDMFDGSEAAAMNDPATGVDKNKFAANFLNGLIRGIDYIERNADVFAAAHTQHGNAWTGQEVKDIVNATGAVRPSDRAAIMKLSA